VAGLLGGATRFFVREVRLSTQERASIQGQYGWTPEEDYLRFYVGRDARGDLVAAAVFVTQFTVHGPVRVAVGLAPDGTVRGASVVELTEETFGWVKPLLDRQFTRQYAGRDARGSFAVPADLQAAGGESMTRFYGEIIASLIRRGAILWEAAVRQAGSAR
jgi:Na+-translocating ferredoxin:NAD+ oxidoreductase RnfG subunit